MRIGTVVAVPDAAAFGAVEQIGLDSAWFAQTPTGPDALAVLPVAAARTERITLGTAVLATVPRHPLVVAQAARTVDALAPGRFVLGVGAGHRAWIEDVYGLPFRTPVADLRDWVTTARRLLAGDGLRPADTNFGITVEQQSPVDVPVVVAATGPRMLTAAGAVADGVLTWMCDETALRHHVLPAIRAGAERAARPAPPLTAGVMLCVSDDPAAARIALEPRLRSLGEYESYRTLLDRVAGPATRPVYVATVGDEQHVTASVRAMTDAGADELVAVVLPDPHDPEPSVRRAHAVLAALASEE